MEEMLKTQVGGQQKDVLINIDCMEYMKKLSNNSIDLTLTDIPYAEVNLVNENGLRQLSKGKADEITFNLTDFLNEVYRITKGTIIIFCAQGQMSSLLKHFWNYQDNLNHKITVRQLVWKKSNPSPINGQYTYLSGCENAVYVKKSGATFNAFCKSNVLEFPTGSSELHPTEKNHDLLADLINDNSNVGDLIFDPCSGSGSTLLMARKLGRHFIGCELDKGFYEKAKRRLDAEVAQATIFDYME